MPDKPKDGPGNQAPQDDQLEQLRKQLALKTEEADKAQKSYQEHRSLESRRDAELAQLRQANARLQSLAGTTGASLQEEDQRRAAQEARLERDRIETARISYMVRHGVDESGLKRVEEFVREHSDELSVYDETGAYDYKRIFDTAGLHLRNQEREEKLKKYEEMEAKARETSQKDKAGLMARAGIVGQTSGEGTQQLDVSKMTSDQMVEEGLVPGFEHVPKVNRG